MSLVNNTSAFWFPQGMLSMATAVSVPSTQCRISLDHLTPSFWDTLRWWNLHLLSLLEVGIVVCVECVCQRWGTSGSIQGEDVSIVGCVRCVKGEVRVGVFRVRTWVLWCVWGVWGVWGVSKVRYEWVYSGWGHKHTTVWCFTINCFVCSVKSQISNNYDIDI